VGPGFVARPDADLRVSATNARFGELSLTNLAATAQVTRDSAIFDIGDAEAYGGHAQARLQLSTEPYPGRAEVIVSGQQVDTARLDQAMALPRALPRGLGDFSITVNAPIASWREMARNAQGKVSIEMTAGVRPGLGLDRLMNSTGTTRYFSLDTQARAPGFASAKIHGEVRDGVVSLDDALVSYPDGNVMLRGIVSHGGSLALTAFAQPAPPAQGEGLGPQAPTRCFIGGSWNRPFATHVTSAPERRD